MCSFVTGASIPFCFRGSYFSCIAFVQTIPAQFKLSFFINLGNANTDDWGQIMNTTQPLREDLA